MNRNVRLPEPFRDLEPWTVDWLIDNERDRLAKLVDTSIEELREFYNAMFPRADSIVAWLNQFELNALPKDAQHLFHLLMTFVETAHPIELGWSETDIDRPMPVDRIRWGSPSTTSPISTTDN